MRCRNGARVARRPLPLAGSGASRRRSGIGSTPYRIHKEGGAVGQRDAFDEAGHPVRAVQLAPCLRGRPDAAEDHGPGGLLRQRAPGAHGSVAVGGEDALDGGRGAQVVPVLGREVVRQAGKASVSLVRQATPRTLLAPDFSLEVSMVASAAARVPACEIPRRSAVTAGCMGLGKWLRTFDILWNRQTHAFNGWWRVPGKAWSSSP